MLTLLDENKQFFKSQCGLPSQFETHRETPRQDSFCQHVVDSGAPLIVEDAHQHPLVSKSAAIETLGITAYLGVPLSHPGGPAYGAFCAVSSEPRHWSAEDFLTLTTLAAQVMREIDLRTTLAQKTRELEMLRHYERQRALAVEAERHDLRTPLHALLLGLQGLRLLGKLNGDQQIALEMAERNGKSLSVMLTEMLDLASIDATGGHTSQARQPLRPIQLVSHALEQVASLARDKNHKLESSVQAAFAVLADSEKIEHVLVNLLTYAILTTPEGGVIDVSVSDRTDDAGRNHLLFSVRDTGPGLSEEDRASVFSADYLAEASGAAAAALGLTFCRHAVEAHGGRIWVDSKLGQGATFSFTLYTDAA